MHAVGAVVLLHQGGWDEILLLVVPGLLFFVFRWLASKRPDPDGDRGSDGLPGPPEDP